MGKKSTYVWTQNIECINLVLVIVENVFDEALLTTVVVLNCFIFDNLKCLITWHVHIV